MAKFPKNTAIPMDVEVSVGSAFTTVVTQFDDQMREQRKRKVLYPKRDVNVNYTHLSLAYARTLWQFYEARYGRFETFYFTLPYWDTYDGEYIATGDGDETVFTLPTENIASYSIYLNESLQTEGPTGVGSYEVSGSAGPDGNDRLEFWVAPAEGQRITVDFTGNLVIRSRYQEDNLTFQRMWDKFTTMGVALKGLLNDE